MDVISLRINISYLLPDVYKWLHTSPQVSIDLEQGN
jgi:hypothetical protein